MNKCDICGKFRKWEELEYSESLDMDIGGNIKHDSWVECKKCIEKQDIEDEKESISSMKEIQEGRAKTYTLSEAKERLKL